MRTFRAAFAATIFFFVFFAASSYGADVVKIGIVDLQKVFETSSAGKLVRADINKKGKKMEAELKAEGAKVDELRKKVEREAQVMSREQREDKEREIEIKIYDLKRLKKRYNEELMKLQNQKLEEMKKEIFEIVQDMGKKDGFLLIIEKIGVLYSPSTIDVTDQLIELYNAKY